MDPWPLAYIQEPPGISPDEIWAYAQLGPGEEKHIVKALAKMYLDGVMSIASFRDLLELFDKAA